MQRISTMANETVNYAIKTNRKDRIIFLVKLLIYVGIHYLNEWQPALYSTFTWMAKVTGALSFFLGANLLISLGRLIVLSWYARKNRHKPLSKDNFVLGINRIISVLNALFMILAVMIFFGIDLLKFVTSITIVAAAIALLSKDYITNMINGLIIMFSDQLSLGDQIRIGEYKGRILDITLINVVLQNDDDDIILIPNSIVFTTLIVNQSKQNTRKLTIEFELDRKVPHTPQALEERLRNAIHAYSGSFSADSFSLKTLEIKKDFIQFKVQLLMPVPDKTVERSIRRTLNTEILSIAEGHIL